MSMNRIDKYPYLYPHYIPRTPYLYPVIPCTYPTHSLKPTVAFTRYSSISSMSTVGRAHEPKREGKRILNNGEDFHFWLACSSLCLTFDLRWFYKKMASSLTRWLADSLTRSLLLSSQSNMLRHVVCNGTQFTSVAHHSSLLFIRAPPQSRLPDEIRAHLVRPR